MPSRFIFRAALPLALLAPSAQGGTPINDPIPAPIEHGDIHVRLVTVAEGLTAPNWGTEAPGHPGLLYVADQDGIVWSIDLESGAKSVFLDVSSLLIPLGIAGPGSYDERGLLGLAFHPDYQKNGLLYTYTSEPADEPADFSTIPPRAQPSHQNVVTEWQVLDPSDPDATVDPLSARVLLRSDHPQFNHDGGATVFGPDGMLYISIGDGGAGDDQGTGHGPDGNGQNIETILGTILRIDPLGSDSANGQYGVPMDNPFAGDKSGVDEIFAYGFRNPFRMSFERGGEQRLIVGDVGQNQIEEIDVVVSGGNYGWRLKEGTFLFDPNGGNPGFVYQDSPGEPAELIDPIAQYDHDEGIAVLGGFVYEGTQFPALKGRYVFGDFVDPNGGVGRIFHMPAAGGTIEEFRFIGQATLGLSMLGLGRDAAGEIYALANFTQTPFGETGVVLRLAPALSDFDGSGGVDGGDLGALLGAWGPCPGCPEDLTGDGMVDGADVGLLLGEWTG